MGRPHTSRTKIEEIAISYYTNLFRSTVPVSRIPTPTQEVAPRIEEWELERAIRQMKPRKAPGPDRISADFLKSVSHTIIKQLTDIQTSRRTDTQTYRHTDIQTCTQTDTPNLWSINTW
uniref:Transposase n=1 Tax=Haemonchus contortus TaxID=6289 RepID=A0A7I4YHH4_HAECO